MQNKSKFSTTWQGSSNWYTKHVGLEGSYFHQHVVIPNSLRLLNLNNSSSLLDLGCGQGILARSIPKEIFYQGIDLSYSLIEYAKKNDRNSKHHYLVGDITKPLGLSKKDFSHIAIILTLQNIEYPQNILTNASHYLSNKGKLVIILNHPCFRIPRQSSWGIDEQNKMQYRKINRYMSPQKIPIITHPGLGSKSPVTWSFHHPISHYSEILFKSGFIIEKIEEWTSDKESEGRFRKMENRSRSEIPLFMAILAIKS
jgi:ubiquinone/menaquinone biosynthesis C-methylase UbiE